MHTNMTTKGRTEVLYVRVSPAVKDIVKQAAAQNEIAADELVRRVLLEWLSIDEDGNYLEPPKEKVKVVYRTVE